MERLERTFSGSAAALCSGVKPCSSWGSTGWPPSSSLSASARSPAHTAACSSVFRIERTFAGVGGSSTTSSSSCSDVSTVRLRGLKRSDFAVSDRPAGLGGVLDNGGTGLLKPGLKGGVTDLDVADGSAAAAVESSGALRLLEDGVDIKLHKSARGQEVISRGESRPHVRGGSNKRILKSSPRARAL